MDLCRKLELLPPPRSIGLPDQALASLLAAHTCAPPAPSPPKATLSSAARARTGSTSEAEPRTEPNGSGALPVWRPQLEAHICWKSLQDAALLQTNPFYLLGAHQVETCPQCCRFAAAQHQYEREQHRYQNHQKFVADRDFLAEVADQASRLWLVRVGQAESSPPSPPPVWTWFNFRHTQPLHRGVRRRRQQRWRAERSAASWQQLPACGWGDSEEKQ